MWTGASPVQPSAARRRGRYGSCHGLDFRWIRVGPKLYCFFSAASISGRNDSTETPKVPPENPSM
jgi:hypothetical protein